MKNLTFSILRSGDTHAIVKTVPGGVIKIGRHERSTLRIQDDSVSAMHAVIEVDSKGAVHVIDLGSITRVNGKEVNKSVVVPGDMIGVGSVEIHFVKIEDAPSPEPSPASVPSSPKRHPLESVARRWVARLVRLARTIEAEDRRA
jgi:pSer/pThr/pTyr-binding forkhead associated (FHA) protein